MFEIQLYYIYRDLIKDNQENESSDMLFNVEVHVLLVLKHQSWIYKIVT